MVVGADAAAVGAAVGRLRASGDRAAGFVGTDEDEARRMAEEMLGGVDEVVRVGPGGPAG